MDKFEYCNHCGVYLGVAVWGLFDCPHCNEELAIAKHYSYITNEEDELDD